MTELKTPCDCPEWSSVRNLALDGMCTKHNPLIDELKIGKRYRKLLQKQGIYTVLHLVNQDKNFIYSIKGLGLKGIGLIVTGFKDLGIICPFSQQEKLDLKEK